MHGRHSPTDRGRYLPQVCEVCIYMEDILQQTEVITGKHSYLPQVYEVCQEDNPQQTEAITYYSSERLYRMTFLLTTGL